ncbi:MAG: hypothetical protein F6K58_28025 [Symploca sp. SIO2E9]|nr:hypothetical protein [Symploca sp. SIO2E9]
MAKKKILEVRNVKLSILESLPLQLSITAFGSVPTTRWEDAELIPYVYIQPPPDGIYDYDFVAKPPTQTVPQVITPIVANRLEPLPDSLEGVGFKGVRIHASLNSKVALLGQGSGQTIVVKGILTDEGIECQALRSETNELYTLVGDLKGLQVGDKVCVAGTIAEFSFCQQGQTIVISWIGKYPPKA